jgi:mannitol/fructose-specific phosphotransferase system IIA component (Ntr-type)
MDDLILLDVEGQTKAEVLLNIAKSAKRMGLIEDEQALFGKFLAREERSVTVLGNSLTALPKAYLEGFKRPFAFIFSRTKNPVKFDSLDGKPVRIVLASLTKDKESPGMLKEMARIAGLLRKEGFREAFLKARDKTEVRLLLKNDACQKGAKNGSI